MYRRHDISRQDLKGDTKKLGRVLANSFLDILLTITLMIERNTVIIPNFVETLQTLLTRVYIKKEICLIAEQDGELLAVALLQLKDFRILSYLRNGGTNIFLTFDHKISLNTLTL